MKKFFRYSCLLVLVAAGLYACEMEGNYPGAVLSDYIAMLDLRAIYKTEDITLTKENMAGATKIAGVVVSDHRGNNLPKALVMLQDSRRLNLIRGIAVQLANAADFLPGDSLQIAVEGKVLTKVDGILQIKGVAAADIVKVSSNNPIPVNRVNSNLFAQFPDRYESVLSVIVKGGFNPLPKPTDKFGGDWIVNDGFANTQLHTEAGAEFADSTLPVLANYYGIYLNMVKDGKAAPQFRMRRSSDYQVLSSEIILQPILITGFVSDAKGGDGNYEYVQMMATRDIDFAATPFSMVVSNNAGASNPTGAPANGWATGNQRTYKINLNQGSAKKGTFFYAGGKNKLINGGSSATRPASTSIADANWIRNYDYVALAGEGFGAATGGLMANSGNAFGIAVFEGTTVTKDTRPVDVMWVSGGGNLFSAGPPQVGYRVCNNDWYDVINPVTLESQPFFRQGTNNTFLSYNTSDLGYFYILGGEYNITLGRWTKARSQTNYLMSETTQLKEIQSDSLSTKLVE